MSEWDFRGYCPRRATGDDRLCTQHRTLREKWAAQDAATEARRRAGRFTDQWRKDHPGEVYSVAWVCTLCGKVIQEQDSAPSVVAAQAIEAHTIRHGADWLAYEDACKPADGGE